MLTKKLPLLSVLLSMVLCGCATPTPPPARPVEIPCPKLPPAPASVMEPETEDFQESLLNFFSASPDAVTASGTSSPPAKP